MGTTDTSKRSSLFSRLLGAVPVLLMAAALIWYWRSGRDLSVEAILDLVPDDPVHAVLILWAGFAVKSLSLVFPVQVLFAASGALFPLPVAILVNTVGIAITLCLPYWIGRANGRDLSRRLLERFPKLQEIRTLRTQNHFFFSFIVRALGVLSCDLVSLYLGNSRFPFGPYISGAVLGFMPSLICATVLGTQISDIRSPWFWLALGVNVLVSVVSILVYRWYKKKSSPS